MTISPERATRTMSDLIAEEIRVALTRQRMSQRQFAAKLGVSPAWLNYRLTGVQEIGVNDLKRIADALEVGVYDLLPPPEVANSATFESKHPYISVGHSAVTERAEAGQARPIGRGHRDSTRPRSTARMTSTRPPNARPTVLPRAS